ncbi:TetR/AcrR family transcriptional regulator [Novosphingobium olei]|uniref:TetR/AcrR family transcriptional regulator n=1 Tax=Novosphingobium olei TaxID=2728851 RepID=UPI00309172D7|nr:TetR/AcrR family transcriptional regulator [Novosphingobium olei]
MKTDDTSSSLAPHPERPLLYSSPQILARRRRLLKEARRMLAEDGIDGFSIRKLCQRAEVAQRTLYNAFHNKDRLIALAIREAFDEYSAFVRQSSDTVSVKGWLSRTVSINRRNFHVRNYTTAVCALYFAPGTARDVFETLLDMSLRGNLMWLEQRRGDIGDWIDLPHFARSLADVQYATINDWCLGRTPDERYLPSLVENMLMMLVGAVQGSLAEEAAELLAELETTGTIASIADMSVPRVTPRKPSA